MENTKILRTLAPATIKRRTTFGCFVSTAKWIGAWASSFFWSNTQGAGARRIIAQIMCGISLMIARCSWLYIVKYTEIQMQINWRLSDIFFDAV